VGAALESSLPIHRQQEFAQDILSAYQLSMQLAEWEKQYAKGTPAPPAGGELK